MGKTILLANIRGIAPVTAWPVVASVSSLSDGERYWRVQVGEAIADEKASAAQAGAGRAAGCERCDCRL